MKYVAVVVTYNRKRLLIEALHSLLEQTVKPEKIILINNHSTDGTADLLEKESLLTNERIDYRKLPDNIGGSGGFYEGLKVARTYDVDWVALSDDDAIYEADYFEKMQRASQKHPKIGAFSGNVMLTDGRLQSDQRGSVSNEYWVKKEIMPADAFENVAETSIDWFSFCGCVIDMKIIKKIGLPEKDYFIWWDDFEYSLRIRQYSKLLNINDAHIIHKTAIASVDTISRYQRDWRTYYNVRNKVFTMRKHGKSKLVTALYLVYWYPRLMTTVFQGKFAGNRNFVLKQYNSGFWDGVQGKMGKSLKHLPGSV
ncbi:MAG TPA: glycosyl transferase family 2 [Lactobacillus sp.]|nr:glycosyl transferase family 2 [Lactobacillus sp.]